MIKAFFFCIASLLFFSACNQPPQNEPIIFTEPLPESEGEQLYLDMKCPSCHGFHGSGGGFFSAGLEPKPVDFTSPEAMGSITDAQLAESIRNGKGGGMPGNRRLTDHQISELVRYIRSLSESP